MILDFWRSFYNRVWGKTQDQQDAANPIKAAPRRPFVRDWTDSCTVNGELTKGLWHNSYQGFKLAGALAFTPIAVPLWLMGVPVPRSQNEALQTRLSEMVAQRMSDFQSIHKGCHRDGTVWVFPFYSSKDRAVIWEFIPDMSISDIIRDLRTGEVVKIIVDEQRTISIGENQTAIARQKRTFSREEIVEEWVDGTGQIPPELRGVRYQNTLGIMPIPFANNKDGGEVRGHSDYERILSDLKNYHDTDLALSEMLVKFRPKLVQYTSDPKAWRENNAIDTASLDIATLDFILNITEKEKTEMLWNQNITDAHLKKLTQIFWKLVQGSGIPELFWGTKVEGNLASADNQLDIAINYVKDKQNQKNDSYRRLIVDTLRLDGVARMANADDVDVTIEWNTLDLIPESIKAQIFQSFCTGLSAVSKAAALTKEQQWKLWTRFYPGATESDFNEYVVGISDMSKHVAFTNASYAEIADLKTEDELTDDSI